MPITKFQVEVFKLLRKNRNPDSYVAGGTAIHRLDNSLRYSHDIDLFHETDLAVVNSFNADKKSIFDAKLNLTIHIQQPSFIRAKVSNGMDEVELDWVRDTAFRFFPVIEDSLLGYRLHDVDLVVNKVLALGNRSEVRDVIDVVEANREILALDAAVWAACGKDPGFTPELLLEMISRNSGFSPIALEAEKLSRQVDPVFLKKSILELLVNAKTKIKGRDPQELGCLYLSNKNEVCRTLPAVGAKGLVAHFGSLRGSWPKISLSK